jgi:hypothetical protein
MARGRLKLRLVRDIEIVRGGERLTLPASKKARALLAYLAVTAKRQRIDARSATSSRRRTRSHALWPPRSASGCAIRA